MNLLIVEDDAKTSAYVADGLRGAGHSVDVAGNGIDGLRAASEGTFDVLVVDRLLPGVDGLSLVKSLRANGNRAPVLFLTTMGGVSDRVHGLEAGGDDYLLKPFAFSELLARINALARRPPLADTATKLTVGDLEMDLLTRQVRRAGCEIVLTPQSFRLLEFFMRHIGQVVTRTMLLERVWEFHFDPRTSVVETHISRLRSKIRQVGEPELIQTVRGAGYVIRPPG